MNLVSRFMSEWFGRIRLLGGLRVSGKILVKLKQGVGGGQTTVTTLMEVMLRVMVKMMLRVVVRVMLRVVVRIMLRVMVKKAKREYEE